MQVVIVVVHALISIHALLAESDVWMGGLNFNDGNFYPRSPCGERRYIGRDKPNFASISIHALLAESDNQPGKSHKLAE